DAGFISSQGGSGEVEPVRAVVFVDRTPGCSEYTWNDLPLVEEDRLVQIAQSSVRVSFERGCLSCGVELDGRAGAAGKRRRLARGAGAQDHDGRQLLEQLVEQLVEQAAPIGM